MSLNTLDQLKQHTTVVADTGDFALMRQYQPQDATTNPSLILKAAQKAEYAALVQEAVAAHKAAGLEAMMDALLVRFGLEILRTVPGRVSTEVDARLSFDTAATVAKARHLIGLYAQAGVDKSRILIKIASTWEGIQAARVLEAEGIHCNLTLLFSLPQAVACAQAKVKLISPFVGRILDWYKKSTGQSYTAQTDPGVLSVREIFQYYKTFGIQTEVMGASFRNVDEIMALAGCDLLTISPELLGELAAMHTPIDTATVLSQEPVAGLKPLSYNEAQFRYALNANAMASEKLGEGIRAFAADTEKLEAILLAA